MINHQIYSGSILDDCKKLYLILIIAFKGTALFKDLVVTNVTVPSAGQRLMM